MYRILIVEDEEGIAQAVKEQAELWGAGGGMRQRFSKCHDSICGICPASGPDGYWTAFYNGYYCAEKSGRSLRYQLFSFLPLPII